MSDDFRRAARAVMFSSDVSARGVDYPDVSLVLQVGVPSDKAQYVHRVGRTARAGKAGQALLVLCEFEQGFLNQVRPLVLVPACLLRFAPGTATSDVRVDGPATPCNTPFVCLRS